VTDIHFKKIYVPFRNRHVGLSDSLCLNSSMPFEMKVGHNGMKRLYVCGLWCVPLNSLPVP
jgi:hypothetical protein